MMRRRRTKRRPDLGLEALEGRKVPSTASGVSVPPGGHETRPIDLQATAQGVPTTVVGNPDVGTTVDFEGRGNVEGVGPAKVTGSLHGTGFFASSRVEGTITLAVGKGRLALRVEGPTVARFVAPGSGAYAFSVAAGTGAFRGDSGTGTVELALGPRSFAMTFAGKPGGD